MDTFNDLLGIRMNQPSGISRRIEQCVKHIQTADHEGALVNLFPALDKTAKKRWPKDGVGERIRAFLEDEEALISAIATGNVFTQISVNRVSITDALYKFGRTSIAHEGELDPRLQFNDSGSVEIGAERWNLPSGYIIGMSVAVIVAPENKSEKLSDQLSRVGWVACFSQPNISPVCLIRWGGYRHPNLPDAQTINNIHSWPILSGILNGAAPQSAGKIPCRT